jgi:hypothetical protein
MFKMQLQSFQTEYDSIIRVVVWFKLIWHLIIHVDLLLFTICQDFMLIFSHT